MSTAIPISPPVEPQLRGESEWYERVRRARGPSTDGTAAADKSGGCRCRILRYVARHVDSTRQGKFHSLVTLPATLWAEAPREAAETCKSYPEAAWLGLACNWMALPSSLFPPMMLSSIVKRAGRAEVEISPSGLTVSIYPHRATYLAKELFDVGADVENMLICLRLENGVNAKVLELNGAEHETLDKCFGNRVAGAIRSSRKFETEKDQGEVVTKCVSLEIKRYPCFSCSFSLELGPKLLSNITAEIWPPP